MNPNTYTECVGVALVSPPPAVGVRGGRARGRGDGTDGGRCTRTCRALPGHDGGGATQAVDVLALGSFGHAIGIGIVLGLKGTGQL